MAGTVYKISCKHNNDTCNCFYIRKSQQYIKTRIQEHIGEVMKLYDKYILCPNQNAMPPHPTSQATQTTRSSGVVSLATQDLDDLPEPLQSPLTCIIIKDVPSPPPEPHPTLSLRSRLQPSVNESTINEPANDGPPQRISIVDNPPVANTTTTNNPEAWHQPDVRWENCSALACHLFAHVKNIKFDTKAEVAAWCWSNIQIEIMWHSNMINLMKTGSTKACWLCTAERMIIGQNFYNAHQRTKIINLKSKIRGICNCKTRFLWFNWSN